MVSLATKIRSKTDNIRTLREGGLIPGVLYGPVTPNQDIAVDAKTFRKVYEQTGESELVSLQVDGKEHIVLVYDTQLHPLSGEVVHIDFYQPRLDKPIEITVPLEFVGEAPAVKELAGTLVKNIQEVEVRALPQNLPHEIKVNVERLAAFEDRILIKDIMQSKDFEILREPNEIVAMVVPPQDVEAELAVPIQENIEAVEVMEKGKKEEAEEGALEPPAKNVKP
ncbi:MAG: 50S ribosomal protein L25 [Candidatus Wildermuthbacteria bacterium]|nr:50S ribosomal protein L25 [Candidatus Wildermuthbacteria bacterium]